MTNCTRNGWRECATGRWRTAGSASGSPIPEIDLAQLAQAQGALGFGPVTDGDALAPTFREAIEAVEAAPSRWSTFAWHPAMHPPPLRDCFADDGGDDGRDTTGWMAKMPVDPQIQALLDMGAGVPATNTLPVAEARTQVRRTHPPDGAACCNRQGDGTQHQWSGWRPHAADLLARGTRSLSAPGILPRQRLCVVQPRYP